MVGKRKRAGTAEDQREENNEDSAAHQQEQFQDWLQDVLVVLKEQDTTPPILDHPITSNIQSSRDTKRTKLVEGSEKTTVATLIEAKAYTSIDEIVEDVDGAVNEVIQGFKEAMNNDLSHAIALQSRKEIFHAIALKKELDRLIQREMIQRPATINSSSDIKNEPPEGAEAISKSENVDDNVLTLLADIRPPKQLFTSMQKSTDKSQRLNELSLPNGITTTRITPLHSINEGDKDPVPKFKDRFAPPPTLPPLTIPKSSKYTTTKSSSIHWHNPAVVEPKPKPSRREGYTAQGLSTGSWLAYNVAPSPSQMISPESKRKQRDRALSFGESQNAVSQQTITAHNQAKEDALYRSVYSSFAPSRDDSAALVVEQQKNRLWYAKYGESRYRELLDIRDEANTAATVGDNDDPGNEEVLDLDELEKSVSTWKPDEDEQVKVNTEAEDILLEISDLLETLDSHRRIRASTPAMGSRPMMGQNQQLTSLATSPTSPSTAEFDVYEMLKSQLTLIISNLPPYLLSKLDGDRLGALKISTNIQTESKNQKGSLEENEAAIAAKKAVAPVIAPVESSLTAQAYSNVPGRSNSYLQAATPAQQHSRGGYGASTAPRPSTNSSYLQNPQYSNRPASSNYASNSARPAYPQGVQPPQGSAAPRYNYAQQYGQQQSQSSYGSYQNGYRPYPGQNGPNYNYSAQYQNAQNRAPSTPAQPAPAYRGSQTDYQQRAVPPQGYGYGSAQVGRSASPQNQQRPSVSGQVQGSHGQRPPLLHQSSSQYSTQGPGSPLVNGTSTLETSMQHGPNAIDQATIINRQKFQIAEQQIRQGSGTPQPTLTPRQYSPQQQQQAPNGSQQNGPPAPQQNGIAAG